jgi:hypothetical protein
MKRKRAYIFFAILVLLVSAFACGIFDRPDERTDMPVQTAAPTEISSADDSKEQQEGVSSDQLTEKSEAAPLPDVDLDDEYRSDAGGYAFQPISGYEFEEFFGLAALVAPDANPDLGPMLMLIGGTNEQESSDNEIFNNFIKDAEREDVEILEQKEIRVDGKSGLLADFVGEIGGEPIVGRIVVVAVTPTQQFTMFASAPKNRWDAFEPSFDAVLSSIYFFEPQEFEPTEALDDVMPNQHEEESSGQPPILDIPSLDDFPTEANQLLAGGFAYLLASSEDFPTIVAQGSIKDQSTNAEYIIGLVSKDQDNTLTIFLPLDIEQGVYPMKQYDPNAASKAPGAVVYMGLTQYTNTDGIIMVDAMVDNTITGSVHFTAADQNGNEIAVTGFFNTLPLAAP